MNHHREAAESARGLLRQLPSMDRLLSDERVACYAGELDRAALKDACASVLSAWRERILNGETVQFDESRFFAETTAELRRQTTPSLRPLLNCTGVVVHTNLGRSCLAEEAVDAAAAAGMGYSTLEYDLEKGERGQRNSHVESLLCRLTGAEAAVVVNNNAAAVLLVLAALAANKDAVVSRGELVEIGGSFRIPDIMRFAGTRLVETGCTNRTHLRDYENAITDETVMLLKVHPSNFRVVGFVTSPEREELAKLAHSRGLLLVEDLGSGILVPNEELALEGETTVTECLNAGVDLVTFSGDKILGGPQIGAVVGRKDLISRLRRYPLLRALRCDKMTLAALEATLRMYLRGDWKKIPTLEMITASEDELRLRAERFAAKIAPLCNQHGLGVRAVPCEDAVGGGAYPERPLAGWAVALCRGTESFNPSILQSALRACQTPVVAAVRDGALLFHMRTLRPFEEERLAESLREALERIS
ncbi:MAG: L-seryl-tRNA(Sec) selenium transferase [Pyramidobacter sp.]|nr:L-seryl-tRNA(Sec) selenium transferase [Pyramidobacter sp.]